VLNHKGDVFEDLGADSAHVFTLEAQELIFLGDLHQVDILQAVFHRERHMDFTVDDATF